MRIFGHIDRCDAARIDGWIFSPEAPEHQYSLEVIAGGEVIGAMHAGHLRADLKAAGLGNGFCAFMFDMPAGVSDEALRDIRLKVVGTNVFLLPDGGPTPGGNGFRSRFGGLWVDRSDWIDILGERHRSGKLDDETAQQIYSFVRDGYVVLPGAVPARMIASLNDEIERGWSRPPLGLMIETLEPSGQKRVIRPDPRLRDGRTRMLDFYAVSETARRVIVVPAPIKFLTAVLDDTPKVFEQFVQQKATGAALTKDSATVRLPGYALMTIASCVALEDITAGSGEIEMLTGSHHGPEFLFGGSAKSMFGHEDEAGAFAAAIATDAGALGHKPVSFTARAGDVLIRHADLAYADTKPARSSNTRRMMTTHFTRASYGVPRDTGFPELKTPACVFASWNSAIK